MESGHGLGDVEVCPTGLTLLHRSGFSFNIFEWYGLWFLLNWIWINWKWRTWRRSVTRREISNPATTFSRISRPIKIPHKPPFLLRNLPLLLLTRSHERMFSHEANNANSTTRGQKKPSQTSMSNALWSRHWWKLETYMSNSSQTSFLFWVIEIELGLQMIYGFAELHVPILRRRPIIFECI